ncbi:MFS transporter [Amorphus sp. 3PC139-8]|uniref:MFS transporter n=1 Tax=Amorphus sp. 3PC139-8 TaxID=2735676 RepID=UPI00345DEB72
MTLAKHERNRALALSSLGGGLEFYDFVIYAVFAETLGRVFFPASDPSARLLAAFAVFAAGYLVRPIGGVLFSHFGDRHGRKAMLRLSIAGMAGATVLMALLPGYAHLGVTASIVFVVLRMIQGLCLGGEIPGALTLITETLPKRRGFACGTLFLMINVGLLLAQAVQWLILESLDSAEVTSFGWRIGFLVGGLIAVVGFFLRAQLSESPAFADMESKAHKVPVAALLKSHRPAVVYGFLVTSLGAATVSLLYLYMDSYLNDFLHYDSNVVSGAGLIGVVIFSLPMPLAGLLGDKIGLKAPATLFAVLLAIAAIPVYAWIHVGQAHLLPAMLVISVIAAFAWGIGPAVLTAIFPTNVRYSGVAMVYNLGFAIVGGLTPLAATYLIQRTGSTMPPAYLLAVFAALGAVGALFARIYPPAEDGHDSEA